MKSSHGICANVVTVKYTTGSYARDVRSCSYSERSSKSVAMPRRLPRMPNMSAK